MREEFIGNCRIILGDCREIIPSLPMVSAIITDPPYILSDRGPGKSHFGMSLDKFDGDAYKDIVSGWDYETILPLLEALCAPFNMFCFCSNRQISRLMAYQEQRNRITTLLVWNKTNAAPFANGVWTGDIEYCIHARDSGAIFQGTAKEKQKVSRYPIVQDKAHPSVKPLPLIMKYVKICSNAGETILDPFMGSGTTGIACIKMQRVFIGIESEERYFDVACRRIADEEKQSTLDV